MTLAIKRLRSKRGFTLLEMLVLSTLLLTLSAIAFPAFQNYRIAAALSQAEQQTSSILATARWMAITSGQPRQLAVAVSGDVIQIIDPATDTVLTSVNLAPSFVTVTATNLPAIFDSRGFVAEPTPTITITSAIIGRSRTFSVNPLGKFS